MARAAASLEDPSLLTSLSEWSKKNAKSSCQLARAAARGEKASCRFPLGRCSLTRSPCCRLGSADIYSICWDSLTVICRLGTPLMTSAIPGMLRWYFLAPLAGDHSQSHRTGVMRLVDFRYGSASLVSCYPNKNLKMTCYSQEMIFFTWSTVTRTKRCRKIKFWYFGSTWLRIAIHSCKRLFNRQQVKRLLPTIRVSFMMAHHALSQSLFTGCFMKKEG